MPIYMVDGTEVATSANALFAGSILHVITEADDGNPVGGFQWTGSNADGTATSGHELGSADPVYGISTSGASQMFNDATVANTNMASLYVISGQLIAPAVSAPEPASFGLLAFGVIAMGFVGRVGRRRRRPLG